MTPSSLFTAVVAATTAVVAATTAVVAATTAVVAATTAAVAATTARGDPRVCSWEGGTTEGFALNSKPHPDVSTMCCLPTFGMHSDVRLIRRGSKH